MKKVSLKPNTFKRRSGPLVLLILDGVGLGKPEPSNAVFLAKKPNLDMLFQSPLYRQLKAHGTAVGMPSDADMGNSEVGHNALGAGRVFDQGASLVNQAIESCRLFEGETWQKALQVVKANNTTLHFIGLLSDGNVHSHVRHLFSMLEKASRDGLSRVRIHVLLDGRDVAEKSALVYLAQLDAFLKTLNQPDYKVASGGGRMVTTMDRYNADWSIVERGWNAHVHGKAKSFVSAESAVESFYAEGFKDQYLPPFVVVANGEPVGRIQEGDSVVFFNFRGDRAIELSKAFEEESFSYFDLGKRPNVFFAGMMEYDGDLHIPKHYLVSPPEIAHPVSEYLCAQKIKSFAISETQKYGHVTYFWNGNRSGYIDPSLETYAEIKSDTIPFDQRPEMKAYPITEKTLELLDQGFDFGRVNFPNGDMVGHTGNLEATIKSVEVTDECVGKIVEKVNALKGITVILADHGNADEMYTLEKGVKVPKTSHTLNPVPFVIVDSLYQGEYVLDTALESPGLANVASTLCNLLGYEAPPGYEPSLIRFVQ